MHRLSCWLLLAPCFLPAQTPARPEPLPPGASLPQTVFDLATAESKLLEAWDDGRPLPHTPVSKADRPALRWLEAVLASASPANPFPHGSRSFREAAQLQAFLKTGGEPAGLALHLTGTQAALWRWGAAKARAGNWPAPQRQAWEDRLSAPDIFGLFREYALRHALCFALGEGNERRFVELRERWGDQVPALFASFQRAFALLGSPLPALRLYGLPDLRPVDLSLGSLGFRQLRIEPAPGEGMLPRFELGTALLLPTQNGAQPLDETELEPLSAQEGLALAARVPEGAKGYFLAPCRGPLEAHALMYFPVRLSLDEGGKVITIRMGDAAHAAWGN